jgi:hypothetical protein
MMMMMVNGVYETFTTYTKNHLARSLHTDLAWAASVEHSYVISVLYLWNTVTQEDSMNETWKLLTQTYL